MDAQTTVDLTQYILLALTSISIYVIAAAIVAEMVYFIWWAMGSPQPSSHNPKQLSNRKGLLLSWYGRWLVERYNSFESREDERLFNKAASLAARDTPNTASNGYAEKLQIYFGELDEVDRKINPYKALGGCIICFAPHLANLLLLPILLSLHFGLYPLPLWVWFLAYFFWWAIVLNFIHFKLLKI